MVASRYQASFGYAPRMAAGAYQGGGARNALAPVYSAPPAGSVGGPVGLPQAPAMQAPMAPAAPSLTSGTGALSGQPRRQDLIEGNGVGFGGGVGDANDPGDGYGTGGPTGAPGSGNFGQDLGNFERATRNFLGPAMALGPAAVPAAALGIFGLGLTRAISPSLAARVAPAVLGYDANPSKDFGVDPGAFAAEAPPDASVDASEQGGLKNDTAMDIGGLADPGAKDFGADVGGFNAEAPGAADGLGDSKDSTSGDPGGVGDGGSQGESAGNGTGDSAGDAKRQGGITRYDTDGVLDEVPIRAHENEYVVRPEATMHYGEDIMHALNSGMIPRNALLGLAMARRPTASNHLLQMMMR